MVKYIGTRCNHRSILLYIFSDKNSQRPPRKAYGRLSVEDDMNIPRLDIGNPYDDDLENFNVYDTKTPASPNGQEINVIGGGGSGAGDDDSDIELDSSTSKDNSQRRINETTLNRIQAMAISDDDDYGKLDIFVIQWKTK